MREYFIGLMSGTSLDGLDAVLIACEEDRFDLVATHYEAYSATLKQELRAVCFAETVNLKELGELDARLGLLFGECVNRLLAQTELDPAQIGAIGSHGQTIFHHPQSRLPFSLQIGDPNRIAEVTGITTIADFRRRDIAAGGQGAPLVPAFHQAAFRSPSENRVIVNIGGIANLTVVPKKDGGRVFGFDSGPGNTLMDLWTAQHLRSPMDKDGNWAKSGQVHAELLERMLADPYFRKAPPKSTGQEYFSGEWLQGMCRSITASPEDVQASLCRLTADSIAIAIRQYAMDAHRVLVCGGGAHNAFLLDQIREQAPCPVETTESVGLHPDWVEAVAFAWLAQQTLRGLPGNLPEATGANRPVVLGGIYRA